MKQYSLNSNIIITTYSCIYLPRVNIQPDVDLLSLTVVIQLAPE